MTLKVEAVTACSTNNAHLTKNSINRKAKAYSGFKKKIFCAHPEVKYLQVLHIL